MALRIKDKDFTAHLERCSEKVKSWPKWKREIMGVTKYNYERKNISKTEDAQIGKGYVALSAVQN